MLKYILLGCLLAITSMSFAQLNLPEPSPMNSFKQKVGFTDVSAIYSRPCARGRKIFGGLVPFNELWRTGASDATVIRFSESVTLEGNKIEAGSYSLFSIPSENEWTIILNKDTAMHGTSNYTQELDVVRFKVKAEKSARYYENFTIEVSDIIQNNAVLYLIWENTQVRVNITTNTDEKIVAEIQQKMQSSKNDASLLFQAAKYYYDSNKDLKEPLVWMTQAVGITTDNFYYFHQKALIEAKMGDYKTAILSAKKSLEVAKTNKLTEWVKRNENLIAEWEKLKK
jgi:hypothetical protein